MPNKKTDVRRVLDQVLEKLADVGQVEHPPAMDGRKMTALIMPLKAAKARPKSEPTLTGSMPTAFSSTPPPRA